MRHSHRLRSVRARCPLLLFAAALASALAAAAPATAAPTPTKLTVTAQSPSVDWGATAVLNGVLQTATEPPLPVDQEQVLVQYAVTSVGPWHDAATVTNTAAPYSSGAYTYSWTTSRNYYWLMTFAGVPDVWGPSAGAVTLVKVKPVLGRPACPASVRARRTFIVSGSLKPRSRVGSRTVKVTAERYARGKWTAYRSFVATNADSGSYSKYSARVTISRLGRYRFRAATADTAKLAAARSAYSRRMFVR
jgi:hypothetical protein